MQDSVEPLLAAKLLWAREDGCPVAPSTKDLANEMASFARRRWASFNRRGKNIDDSRTARVNDLARGIATKFEHGGWPMVGALIEDYSWLAEQLATILENYNRQIDDSERYAGIKETSAHQVMNRSRGVVGFYNGKSIAVTWLSPSFVVWRVS